MSHRVTIICDACGREEHFTELYNDAESCTDSLLYRDRWQRVQYTSFYVDPDRGDDAELHTVTELYCPACHRMPHQHESRTDLLVYA